MTKFTFTEKKDTRSGFGDGLYELGKSNPNVVGLCADLTGSLKMGAFQKDFPERFFQVGIAEANMMGIAAGLATAGKIPFTGTFANFSTGRVYDQLRQSMPIEGGAIANNLSTRSDLQNAFHLNPSRRRKSIIYIP